MKYRDATAFRKALEQRLINTANTNSTSLVRLRKLVVIERWLARLLVTAPDRWILKGALALEFRFQSQFRTTKDLDLARQDNERSATSDLLSAQLVDLKDYFAFSIEKVTQHPTEQDGAAVRYRIDSQLDDRQFEIVNLDIGFQDPVLKSPETLTTPSLLHFADIPLIEVPAIPLSSHVAEKLHAYTRTYSQQRPSSRVKDLVDLAVICTRATFEADDLREALKLTFNARNTHALPERFPRPPGTWERVYRELAGEAGLIAELLTGYQTVARFMDPILGQQVSGRAKWDPNEETWHDTIGVLD